MTLGVLWVRNAGPDLFELCIASDSRLTGGTRWDCAQKVFPLPRGDSVLAFAGDTTHAYPLVTQTLNYILSYERAHSRAQDLGEFKGHLGRVVENMRKTFTDVESGRQLTCDLLLAGFDWRSARFKSWRLSTTDQGVAEFQRLPNLASIGQTDGWSFLFYGDDDAAREAKNRLLTHLNQRKSERRLDMEPFEVLSEIIQLDEFDSVGGAPQLVKVFRHMNCLPYNIRCPSAKSPAFLFGPELLDYETNRFLLMDPERLRTESWPPVTLSVDEHEDER